MYTIEPLIRKILNDLPSESSTLDYKEIPYKRGYEADFLKDVIAMLNALDGIGKPKFIILGVKDKTHELLGINPEENRDDNEWQSLVKKISPRPMIATGMVIFEGKTFGYVYIDEKNTDYVYEISENILIQYRENIQLTKNSYVIKKSIFKGQAFTRYGSNNEILTEEERQKLRNTIIQNVNNTAPSFAYDTPHMIMAILCGSWNEQYSGDIDFIEKITGTSYEKFISEVRRPIGTPGYIFTFKNHCWIITNPKKVIPELAPKIFDDQLTRFFNNIKDIFSAASPRYLLPADQRYLYQMKEDTTIQYSPEIIKGIAKTLAILGNNKYIFSNLDTYYISNHICTFIRRLFQNTDWRIYASISSSFEYLAQADPETFLTELLKQAKIENSPIKTYISQKENSIVTFSYGSELARSLRLLALKEEYFPDAFTALILLGKGNDTFLSGATTIVLPWFPQTHAALDAQISICHLNFQKHPDTLWALIMSLMPHRTVSSAPIEYPEYLTIPEIPTQTVAQYYKTEDAFITLACSLLRPIAKDMEDLLDIISTVDFNTQNSIINALKQRIPQLSEKYKEHLWNHVKDMIMRHKSFPNAQWALPSERLLSLDELARDLYPDSTMQENIRLFRKSQYLFYENESHDARLEKESALQERQKAILSSFYKNSLDSLFSFVQKIENKKLAGTYGADMIQIPDILYIIRNSKDIIHDEMIAGLSECMKIDKLMKVISNLDDQRKAIVLSLHRIEPQCIETISKLTTNAQNYYWKNISVWLIHPTDLDSTITIISKLNENGRHSTSLSVLYDCIARKNEDISPDIVSETLINLSDLKQETGYERYEIQTLIKWLQDKNYDSQILCQIELKYLEALDDSTAASPKSLFNKLSSDPAFLLDIVNTEFGNIQNDSKVVKEKCWLLLHLWNKIPGSNEEDVINSENLQNWISKFEVLLTSTADENIRHIAEHIVGKVLFHAPQDESGFFIDKDIAGILDRNGEFCRGYDLEAFNSRGVYTVDPSGNAEFKIADNYRMKAASAQKEGFYHFAACLRNIADSYQAQGEETKRNH